MRILKVPYGLSAFGSSGAGHAPDKVAEQLKLACLNENGRSTSFDITEVVKEKLPEKEADVVIGGNHSITADAFRGFLKRNPGAGIIIFDAHVDASPPIDGEKDLLPSCLEEGLEPSRIIIVGARSVRGEEMEFIGRHNIKVIGMKSIFQNGISNVCDGLMETARQWDSLYVSIDIDVVDPAFAPGTGCTEPGGISSREMIYLIQRLKRMKNLSMADICEIDPSKDINDMTSKLGAKLIKELA